MTKLNALAITSPGSRPLKNTRQERYCRSRAAAQPRIPAYREAGWETSDDDDVYRNACRLERRRKINDRIAYLTRQAEDRIAEKRASIEERLWAIHEADLADYFETYQAIERDHNGRPVQINPAFACLIAGVAIEVAKNNQNAEATEVLRKPQASD